VWWRKRIRKAMEREAVEKIKGEKFAREREKNKRNGNGK
jgi:hypothetical protein